LECDYEDLPYCTEICWLSWHKVLRNCFDLRNEIFLFLETKEQDISDRKSTEWILDLAFMVDNSKRLNLSCQRKINSYIHMWQSESLANKTLAVEVST
jgi:hypothetical protein